MWAILVAADWSGLGTGWRTCLQIETTPQAPLVVVGSAQGRQSSAADPSVSAASLLPSSPSCDVSEDSGAWPYNHHQGEQSQAMRPGEWNMLAVGTTILPLDWRRRKEWLALG